MTDEEKIRFIARHTRMKFGDMSVFLGMRATAIVVFAEKHMDEIDREIEKLQRKEVSE